MRHAEAAITYGQDDATALTFAGFTIGMEGRDRAPALCARFLDNWNFLVRRYNHNSIFKMGSRFS
jgi:hypothetical protein